MSQRNDGGRMVRRRNGDRTVLRTVVVALCPNFLANGIRFKR